MTTLREKLTDRAVKVQNLSWEWPIGQGVVLYEHSRPHRRLGVVMGYDRFGHVWVWDEHDGYWSHDPHNMRRLTGDELFPGEPLDPPTNPYLAPPERAPSVCGDPECQAGWIFEHPNAPPYRCHICTRPKR